GVSNSCAVFAFWVGLFIEVWFCWFFARLLGLRLIMLPIGSIIPRFPRPDCCFPVLHCHSPDPPAVCFVVAVPFVGVDLVVSFLAVILYFFQRRLKRNLRYRYIFVCIV